MALITKPDMEFIWASGGAIVEPSDVKKQTGWTPEVPPHQWENWIQNRQDQYLAHINQRGIPEWDSNTEYEAGGLSYVQGSDGIVYKSVAASGPSTTSQNPTTDVTDTYWTVAFADVGAFLTQAAGDTRYAQRSNNLSDLNSIPTARTNLSVYSKAEIDANWVNITPIALSGTSTDFTGIPDFATEIDILPLGLSTNGTSLPIIQIGDAGGIENTGYDSRGIRFTTGGNPTTVDATNGFIFGQTWAATTSYGGCITLVRANDNTWAVKSAQLISSVANTTYSGYGTKTLSAPLDRIRFTTVLGTDTFDAGTVAIRYRR